MFKFTDIQTGRVTTEEEVREVNYIIKRRAFRYVAAAEEDWLYPERHLRCDHWRKLGDGYLLMPEQRYVHLGGEIYVGYGERALRGLPRLRPPPMGARLQRRRAGCG